MLKGRASTFYYNYLVGKGYKFNRLIYKKKCHFKIKKNKQQYISEWRETTFLRIIAINLGIFQLNCF